MCRISVRMSEYWFWKLNLISLSNHHSSNLKLWHAKCNDVTLDVTDSSMLTRTLWAHFPLWGHFQKQWEVIKENTEINTLPLRLIVQNEWRTDKMDVNGESVLSNYILDAENFNLHRANKHIHMKNTKYHFYFNYCAECGLKIVNMLYIYCMFRTLTLMYFLIAFNLRMTDLLPRAATWMYSALTDPSWMLCSSRV